MPEFLIENKSLTAPPSHRGLTNRVISISMVKNEKDIIEPFLRHNHVFFDAMFVIDNGSIDGTREILHECARELRNVVFCDRPQFAYHQGKIISAATAFIQSAYRADFIVFLDADEFISAENRENFESSINSIPMNGTGIIRWKTFLPSLEAYGNDKTDPMRRIALQRKEELPQFYKSILRLSRNGASVVVEQGAHTITDAKTGAQLPTVAIDDLELLHIPIRSANQLASKAVVGWIANLARDPTVASSSQGFQWKQLYQKVVEEQAQLTCEEVCLEALRYAQDEREFSVSSDTVTVAPPIITERLYSDGSFDPPLTNLAKVFRDYVMSNEHVETQADIPVPSSETQEDGLPIGVGVFSNTWHQKHIFVDRAPFDYLAHKYSPNSVLDIGCGAGWYLKLFQEISANEILGVDGISNKATVLAENEYKSTDLHNPQDFKRRFDLVMCVEVLEHLKPSANELIFDSIARHASNLILFSVAEPGQPGVDHINCMPMKTVLEEWRKRGWVPDIHETLAFRGLSTLSWLRRNPLILKPISSVENASASIEELELIASEQFDWYAQNPGVRRYPFCEEFPVGLPQVEVIPEPSLTEARDDLAQKAENQRIVEYQALVDEVDTLHRALRHAKRYPWKYLKAALKERLSNGIKY